MDLSDFAEEIGADDPVTIAGLATRGGPVEGVRTVMAPAGIDWIRPDEMTLQCGAGTPVEVVDDALAAHGQAIALTPTGTIGGALAVGHSGLRRLGYGPIRDSLLQARYVSAAGEVVKAGGPTVKNVSGFDLCRLLVGSQGTLGFLGEVILRTRPRAAHEQWFSTDVNPLELFPALYQPTSVLWDGATTWILLEGHHDDVEAQASANDLVPADPPEIPEGARWSLPPGDLPKLAGSGRFIAEIGVGIVHLDADHPPVAPAVSEPSETVRQLHRRLKERFDPTGRLNPGVDVLAVPTTR